MNMIKLSMSLNDLTFNSNCFFTTIKGNVYKPYPIMDTEGIIKTIESIANRVTKFERCMSLVEEDGFKLIVGFLPEYGKLLFYSNKWNDRYYCDMTSTDLFSFENDGFADTFTYNKSNALVDLYNECALNSFENQVEQ